MQQKTLKVINETIYYDVLDNGLGVYMYTNKNFHNNYVTLTSRFGSVYKNYTPYNGSETVSLPNGIAHFLEHKLFAQKDGPQPSEFFTNNGALDNALTTFKNTSYLFSGPDKLEDNINFLLDYVQDPYFTDENVESEKGIIIQEINMCNDRPFDRLEEAIRKTCLKCNPFRESIIGTRMEVSSITKDLLYQCYNAFYHPSNMFMVIVGNFEPKEILEVIKKNQSKKTFKDFAQPIIRQYDEPDEVVKKEEIIYIDTEVPKVAFNIKIPTNRIDISNRQMIIYLHIIFSSLFGDTSVLDEKLKKEGIITTSIGIEILNCDSHIIVTLFNETKEYERLLMTIKAHLNNIKISERDLERKKKVIKSNELFSYENVEVINDIIVDHLIYENRIEDNVIGIIDKVNMETLNEVISIINPENSTTVIVKGE